MRATLVLLAAGLLLLTAVATGCQGCDKKSTPSEPIVAAAPVAAAADGQAPSAVPGVAKAAAGPRFSPLPTGPLSKEDTADCDREKQIMDQVTCLGSLAQRRRDPRFCDRIAELANRADESAPALLRSGNAANACHRTIAFVRDDPKLCVAIAQASMAAGCLSYFAMKGHDPALCELGQGEVAASCYLNEAARTHNAALCAKTGRFAEDCSKRLGPSVP